MISNNRRQLARVRNAFLGATALAGFAAAATPASAVVINDNYTPAAVVDTTNVTGVGQMVVDLQNGFIGLCTVSLINPRTVIFASHCVNENANDSAFKNATTYGSANGGTPIGFFFQANNNQAGNSAIGHWLNGVAGGPKYLTRTNEYAYNSNFVVYDTNCCTIGLGNNFLQSDIALAALDTPAVGIPTYTLLFSALSAPAHATIEGYGDNGIGTTGQGTIDFKRRVAENIVSLLGSLDDQDTFLFGAPDGLPANLYMIDFNDPKFGTAAANQYDFNIFHDTATTKEGITAPGDSGGPLIIDHEFSAPTIAAVLSGGDRFFNAQKGASYGTTSFYQPLYLYWDWILANNPYKYVTNTGGNHNWTDSNAFQMALDPAYLTVDAGGNLVNALPTTKAQGEADVPPGFGYVCYYDDCINIKTGAHTNPTPPPAPNPTTGVVADPAVVADPSTVQVSPTLGSRPFNGALGVQGFEALVESMVGSGVDCGAAIVSVDSLTSGTSSATQPTCTAQAATPGTPGSVNATPSAQSNWINPEGFAQVGPVATGESVQGAPGASPGQLVNDTNANPATLAPARYYDVTFAADGNTTIAPGTTITVDRVTVNGANTALTIGGVLNTLINTNSFAGTIAVNGALNSTGSVSFFGGLLTGTGTVTAPSVDFLIGAIAPGTVGTVGTLTINGALNLGAGSTTVIDATNTTSDLIKVNGAATVGGTLVFNPLAPPKLGDSHIVIQATSITGSYNAVPDTVAGVLYPIATTMTVGGVGEEIVTFGLGTFTSQLAAGATVDQITVAGGLDAAVAGGHYNDMQALYVALTPLSGAGLAQALEDLAPDAERAAPLVGDMVTEGYDNMLWQQLGSMGPAPDGSKQAGLRIDGSGLQAALTSASGNSAQSQQLLSLGASIATNPGGGNGAISTGAPATPQQADDAWMPLPAGASGFISGSSLNGSVAIGGGGGKADVRGLIIGAGLSVPVDDALSVGFSFGYADAQTSLRAMPATVQTNTIQASLFARYDFGDNYVGEAFGSYGRQTIETRRIIVVGATAFGAVGHTGGDVPSFGGYFGKSFSTDTLLGPKLFITPAVSLQYVGSSIDAFSETGSVAAMSFADYEEHSGLARLGGDAHMTFDIFNVHVTPNLHGYWVDNFGGGNTSIQSTFAAGPSSVLTFALTPVSRNYAELGLGIDADLGDLFGTQATLSGRYDTTTGRDDIEYGAWTGRLSIKF